MTPYREEIIGCCKKLRLSVNLANRSLDIKGESHQEYLYKLLDSEVKYREKVRVTNLINSAGFPRTHDFEHFRTAEVEFQDTSIGQLKDLEFYNEHKNLLMYGGTGTGKTMLSICIGMQACRQGIPVKFYRTAGLVNQLSEHKSRGTLGNLKKKLDKAKILILDEFGYVPYDRDGAQLLFDYLSEVEGEKRIILSTNLEFSRWVNVLYNEQMTAALVGRLTHHCHLLLFPGQNNRLRESSINEVYRGIANKSNQEAGHATR